MRSSGSSSRAATYDRAIEAWTVNGEIEGLIKQVWARS